MPRGFIITVICNLCRASEGKTVEVPYRGDVNATILDVLGGIRSACTYTGAGKLKEMPKRTTFIRVSQQLNEVFSGGETEKLFCYHLITMLIAIQRKPLVRQVNLTTGQLKENTLIQRVAMASTDTDRCKYL